ncbi:MFS transporter [Amycolatopsis pithecellobii]|uniref:MFS transporter n=1 Tax=Amycolatopsis pithecellobii TaxID=664692 RepID=A0A6N7Z1H1_9PSEU|nr:MFS transporter [Amycolatopsis pithecellobii]MTD54639.1 MFS transporter [Amycolatopsis pithecellobii]
MNPVPDTHALLDAAEPQLSARAELRTHWSLLLAAVLGISVGIAAIPGNALAVFLRAMQQELGWSRAEISLGGTIVLLVVAGVSPLLGWVVDRVRTIWIVVVGLLGLAGCLLLFSVLGPSLGLYYGGCVLMGVAGAGSATVPYARVVSTAFVRAKGFALGLSTIGTGLAAFVLPVVLAPYAAAMGWRAGFVVLAGTVATGAVVIAFLMWRSPLATRPPTRLRRGDVQAGTGLPLGEAVRTRTFWTLIACFLLVMFAILGLQQQLLSYLQDVGVGVADAGRIASLSGIGVIIFRPLAGWVYDRVYAPLAAAIGFFIATVCIVALAVFGAGAAPFAALAIGLVSGAEFDLIGYLAARYFGARSYGRIYGLFYLAATAGGALSGVFYGAVQDATGSYLAAMYTTAALLVVGAGLLLSLRRYPPLEPATVSESPAAA